MVLGSAGMAGHVITLYFRKLSEKYEVIDIARSETAIQPSVLLDITRFTELAELIVAKEPDVIINCIGILNQVAEANPCQAILINSYLPHFLENCTRNTKCKVIHISTDCVFSGRKGSYVENDILDGKGFYAQSKAIGEILNDKDINIRTSIVGPELNENGIGLLHWFFKQKGEVKGYTNTFWSGITTIELAKAIALLIEQEAIGLYHLTNGVRISKYALLKLFIEVFPSSTVSSIKLDDTYQIDKSLINTRIDFNYQVPSYEQMLLEMRTWIYTYKEFYKYKI